MKGKGQGQGKGKGKGKGKGNRAFSIGHMTGGSQPQPHIGQRINGKETNGKKANGKNIGDKPYPQKSPTGALHAGQNNRQITIKRFSKLTPNYTQESSIGLSETVTEAENSDPKSKIPKNSRGPSERFRAVTTISDPSTPNFCGGHVRVSSENRLRPPVRTRVSKYKSKAAVPEDSDWRTFTTQAVTTRKYKTGA